MSDHLTDVLTAALSTGTDPEMLADRVRAAGLAVVTLPDPPEEYPTEEVWRVRDWEVSADARGVALGGEYIDTRNPDAALDLAAALLAAHRRHRDNTEGEPWT